VGFKITKNLQDQYTVLKKAKGEFDEAQKSVKPPPLWSSSLIQLLTTFVS